LLKGCPCLKGNGLTQGAASNHKLAAIMIADVVGFSRLMERDESLTFARLRRLREEVNFPKIEEHGGRVIKTTGDGFIAEFGGATAAVRCGAEILRSVIELESGQADSDRIRFRIGIHLGDILLDGEDIAGDGVNIAARLESLSPVDGMCISSSVREQIRSNLGVRFEDLGERKLKNISRPIRAYAARFSDAVVQQSATAISPTQKAPASKPIRLSIVVLPFRNVSGDPAQDYFADGITTDVTTQLSKIKGSYVIGHGTAYTYKDKIVDAKKLGIELGVRYILTGSVDRFEEGVDTSVQLVDSLTGAVLWADTIQVDKAGIRNIRREVVVRLAHALSLQLVEAEARRSQVENPDNPDATDLSMQGWALFYRSTGTRVNILGAQELFERSLAIQPDYQPALVGRSLMMGMQTIRFPSSRNDELLKKAEADALRAITLDSLDSLAHFSLSYIRWSQKRIEAALAECDNSLALDGNNVRAYGHRGLLLIGNGQPELCHAVVDKALTQSPRDPNRAVWLFTRGWAYHIQEMFEEAIVWSEKSSFWIALTVLAPSYYMIGNMAKAKRVTEQLMATNPDFRASFYMKYWTFSDDEQHVRSSRRLQECMIKLGVPE
jgi:class 3 adenylate cyclase/TolB-like protein